jgi:hypothetical protein
VPHVVEAVMTGGGGPRSLLAAMIAAGDCGGNVDEPMSLKKRSEEASQYKLETFSSMEMICEFD